MMNDQVNPAPLPEDSRLRGFVHAGVLLTLLAGAGLLAFLALPPDEPTLAEDQLGREDTRVVVVPAAAPARLLVLVETEERAHALQTWRELNSLLDANAFSAIEFSGPMAREALEETLVFANVTCPAESCDTVAVLDLRGPGPR